MNFIANKEMSKTTAEELMMTTNEIRILSLWQPWASLIPLGLKKYETRSWGTAYRGKLAIHAAKRPLDFVVNKTAFPELCNAVLSIQQTPTPYGCIVAIVDLIDCIVMTDHIRGDEMWKRLLHPDRAIPIAEQTPLEQEIGDWRPGRYAWKLENVCPIANPIPYKGGQGLRTIRDEATLQAIAEQMALTDLIERRP